MKSGDLELPPGFRFHPTDEELVIHYLCRKCSSSSISIPIIAEIDLYKFDPWDLPGMALYGEKEWYFFSPRDRKYPNGSRPNRAAGSGYWKATGADKPIGNPKPTAIKKALVFYAGKAPRGMKTNWIMHEYRLAEVDRSARKKVGLRLDDWVLCRIYNKKGRIEKQINQDQDNEKIKPSIDQSSLMSGSVSDDRKFDIRTSGGRVDAALLGPPLLSSTTTSSILDAKYVATSIESFPRLVTDSSSSGHVGSTEVTCEKEVQSQPKWRDWSELGLDFHGGTMDVTANINTSNYPFNASQYGETNNRTTSTQYFSPLQDIFMYLQKPF